MTAASTPTGQKRLNNAGRIYTDVQEERIRAHLKHGAKGNCREDQPWDEREWLPILTEELGEAAHELTYDADALRRMSNLRKELVQVAAMACAWIAAIDEASA